VLGRSDNIVACTGVFWKSIEFDNGSIDEACASVKVAIGNIPKGTLPFSQHHRCTREHRQDHVASKWARAIVPHPKRNINKRTPFSLEDIRNAVVD